MNAVTQFFNQSVEPSLTKEAYNLPIEQYRGLCALLVLVAHGAVQNNFLLNNFVWPYVVHYAGAGYLSVLVFFCISGYAIGVSNNVVQLKIWAYIKKRAIRLYPVYLLGIILCLIIAVGTNWLILCGNILFLQNDIPYFHFKVPVFVNYPAWSLNFEVLYYLLFIPLFFIKPKLWQLLGSLFLLSLILINSRFDILFFTSYLNGYYFWILGLLFAWKMIDGTHKPGTVPLLSLLFLHCCQHHLGIGVIILHTLGIKFNTNFNWLFDLPFCLMVMATLTQKDSLILRANKILTYILPGLVFAYLIISHRLFEDARWVICFTFWLLSLLLINEKKISAYLLGKLTYVGKISYGLYLLHVPVAMLIKKIPMGNNQPLEIIVKYTLWIIVTFGLSAVMELVLQPKIKRFFLDKPAHTS